MIKANKDLVSRTEEGDSSEIFIPIYGLYNAIRNRKTPHMRELVDCGGFGVGSRFEALMIGLVPYHIFSSFMIYKAVSYVIQNPQETIKALELVGKYVAPH